MVSSIITNYHDLEQRHLVREKRRKIRIIFRVLISILCSLCIATIVWMFVYLSKQITKFDTTEYGDDSLQMSSTVELSHWQSVDDAEWWSFGPRNEKLWRSILYANLALMLLAIGSCLFAVFLDQYYILAVVSALAFFESILAVGSQYLTLPYYLASVAFFLFAFVLHCYGHFLRLDLIDEFVLERKRLQNEQNETSLNKSATTTNSTSGATVQMEHSPRQSRKVQQPKRSILRPSAGLY